MKPPLVINVAVAGAALVLAIFCEWVIARLMGGSAFVPSVTTLAVIFVMQALPFPVGLWYGLAAGFLLDSVAPPPFGATILLFLFLACVMEVVRAVMADRKSYTATIAMAAGLYILAYWSVPLVRAAAMALKL